MCAWCGRARGHDIGGHKRNPVDGCGGEVGSNGRGQDRHGGADSIQPTLHVNEPVPTARYNVPISSGDPSLDLRTRHASFDQLIPKDHTSLETGETVNV